MGLFSFLPNIKACRSSVDNNLSSAFAEIVAQLDLHNIFNPSFYCEKNLIIFAFRAASRGSVSINSYLTIKDSSGLTVRNISADFYQQVSNLTLIDPKIFKINQDIYISLHTGWVKTGNEMYIIKVYPEIGNLKRIDYSGRQAQERNWAFFSEDQEIYALYSIKPLHILRLDKSSSDSWKFKDYYLDKRDMDRFSNKFTIGTQLAKYQNQYFFIAHRKLKLLNKKLYLGKPCLFDFKNKRIQESNSLLVHSLKSILGHQVKHNTNLFSCTYFSGLQISDDIIKIGYGINDTESGFAKYPLEYFFNSEIPLK